MKKRVLSVVLCMVIIIGGIVTGYKLEASAANTYIINGVPVSYDSVTSGQYNCWIYARDMYYKIWGNAGTSTYNNNRNTADNMIMNLTKEQSLLTVDNLKNFISQAALGSIIRTSNDTDWGLAQDNTGHSQILVQKDSNGLTVFQSNMRLGNGTGSQERHYTWQEYINSWYDADHKYIKYIKWPSATHYVPGTYLDLNGSIDGVSKGNIADAGVADVYIYKNGSLVESNTRITDYNKPWPAGTTYEIKNIQGFGYSFDGVQSGSASLSGTIGSSKVTVTLSFSTIPQSSSAANSITYNNHRYERYDYHLSWTEAKAFCESKGGHLVTITSEQENEAVKGLLSGCPFGVYSIGATDPNRSGNWSWVTGEPFIYENWDPDSEPSQGQEEYYSQIIGQVNPPNKQIGEWNDIENNGGGDFYSKKNTGFICEYETVYTISYNANGGTGAPTNQTKIDGKTLTLSTIQPSREGQYHFIGWALSAGAKQAEYQPGGSFAIDANTTLYAVWKEFYYIDYDANGGPEEIDYIFDGMHYGNVTINDVNLEYEGHHFVGWSLSKDGPVAFQPGVQATFTENIKLYAIWQSVYASGWGETRPDGAKDEFVETKTQYRYATKETMTSTSSTMPGWTLVDTFHVLKTSGWSDWSTQSPPNNAYEVQTRTVYGWYYYICPNCGAHMHGYGTNVCVTWGGGCGGSIPNDFRAEYLTTSWEGAVEWGVPGYYYKNIDGERWFKWADGGTQTQYRYRTSYLETYYNYERWTDMTEWSDTPVEASESVNVETRTLYRCIVDADRIMTLPSALTKIESEAFKGISADAVIIPESVRSIADDAFETGTVIIGKPNSYAQLYAGWNNLLFIPLDG